ncbi:MAG: hypothetical protein OEV21_00030 [Thermoplasmata archaeon]|nr:hypothetical protein [Thermoplasmata archaeon]
MTEISNNYAEARRYLKNKYQHVPTDTKERILSDISKFQESIAFEAPHLDKILDELARLIYRNFEFKEVCIGLIDLNDKSLRYRIFIGLHEEAKKNLRMCKYTQTEFLDEKKHPGIWISKLTKFFISGEAEYEQWERSCFNRPLILIGKRDLMDADIEGDYIDVHIFGKDKRLLGWIELSNTRTGKIPEPETIRWIEILAGTMSPIIQSHLMKKLKS